MAYQPLTPEQFQKARQSGFSPEKIIEMEKKRKADLMGSTSPTVQPATAKPEGGVKGGIVGEILTGNTQRFGKTIGEALNAPKAADQFAQATDMLSNTKNDLVKRIVEKKQRGEDTSRLENALKLLEEDTPKLENFTGDVINKTTGQIAGEALGTALEIGQFGTYGKATKGMKSFETAKKAKELPTILETGKKLVTKPSNFLTKEGAKQALEGAAFGHGVDVARELQEGKGAASFKPGLGMAIGAVAPAIVKGLGKGVEKVAISLQERAAKAAAEADNLIGTIIQGEAKDIPAARRAFSQIDTEGIRNYKDLKDALNTKIKTGSEKLRESLGYEPYVKPLDELTLSSKVGDVTISKNFVDDAISQLEDYYTKTGNYEDAARMQSLRNKAQRDGITIQEINDLAIRHGQDLSGFNANGELASGLKKQLAENTRSGLKRTAREQFGNKVYDETDAALSDLIKTRDLVQDMEEAVLKLEQKTRDASIAERFGALAQQVLNYISFGVSRGFLQGGRDLGLFKAKTSMSAIEIQERLAKNLKRLNEILDGPANQMESRLDKFLRDNKVIPAKPQKLNLNTPPKVYTPLVSLKEGARQSSARGVNLSNQAKGFDTADEFIKSKDLDNNLSEVYNEIYGKTSSKPPKLKGASQGQKLGGSDRKGTVGNSQTNSRPNFTGLAKFVNENPEGFTVNLNGKPATKGFVVSPFKDREMVLDKVDSKSIKDFITKNIDALNQDGFYFGGWKNSKDGKFYLDVSTVKNNLDDAIEVAAKNNQLGIFDLGKGDTVYTKDFLASKLKDVWNKANRGKLPPKPPKLNNKQGGFASPKALAVGAVGLGLASGLMTPSTTTYTRPPNVEMASKKVSSPTLKKTFIGTNYDPNTPSQTRRGTDGIGAAGIKIDENMVASSLKKDGITANLRLGTVIYVPKLNRVFLVADLMNKRFNGQNKIDFATPNGGGSINPEYNQNFDDIQIIREGKGREDVRNFVNSGEWQKMLNQFNNQLK